MKTKRLLWILTALAAFLGSTVTWALTPGTVEQHNPEGQIQYTWYSYLPTSLQDGDPIYLIIYTRCEGTETSYDALISKPANFAGSMAYDAEDHGYVLPAPGSGKPDNSKVVFTARVREMLSMRIYRGSTPLRHDSCSHYTCKTKHGSRITH